MGVLKKHKHNIALLRIVLLTYYSDVRICLVTFPNTFNDQSDFQLIVFVLILYFLPPTTRVFHPVHLQIITMPYSATTAKLYIMIFFPLLEVCGDQSLTTVKAFQFVIGTSIAYSGRPLATW